MGNPQPHLGIVINAITCIPFMILPKKLFALFGLIKNYTRLVKKSDQHLTLFLYGESSTTTRDSLKRHYLHPLCDYAQKNYLLFLVWSKTILNWSKRATSIYILFCVGNPQSQLWHVKKSITCFTFVILHGKLVVLFVLVKNYTKLVKKSDN